MQQTEAMMTQQEIKEKAAKYRRKLNKLNRDKRLLQDKWRILQSGCEHPDAVNTVTSSMFCPDCGNDS